MNLPTGMIVVQRRLTVAWLTTVNVEWAQDEIVNAVSLYNYKKNKAEQVDQHQKVQWEEDKELASEWRDEIQNNDKYADWKNPVLKMMEQFLTIGDRHLERIVAAKHQISLVKPGNGPTLQNPYRADSRHCKLEKTERKEMLAEKVIELDSTEWLSPTVFAPKNVGSLRFCVDLRKSSCRHRP